MSAAGLEEAVDFRFFPIGSFTASTTNTTDCPGSGNDAGCSMDMLESCVIKHNSAGQAALIDWLACFEGGAHSSGLSAAAKCADSAGIGASDFGAAKACYNDPSSRQAAWQAIVAASEATGHKPFKCFPWVELRLDDGSTKMISSAADEDCVSADYDLLQALCASLSDPKPAGCQ